MSLGTGRADMALFLSGTMEVSYYFQERFEYEELGNVHPGKIIE